MNPILEIRLLTVRHMLDVWVKHCFKSSMKDDIMWQGIQTLQTERYNVKKLIESEID